MIEWLIDIGNKYLTRTNTIIVCKVLFALQCCLVLVVFRAMRIGGIIGSISEFTWVLSMSGQLLQLVQDIGFSILFLALMVSLHRNGYHSNSLIGSLVVITFCVGVLTFVVNITGGQRGVVFFLSSIATSVLQVIVGYYLQKTEFARLGKFIMAFPIVMFFSMVLLQTNAIAIMIVAILNAWVLIYAFYKEPLLVR